MEKKFDNISDVVCVFQDDDPLKEIFETAVRLNTLFVENTDREVERKQEYEGVDLMEEEELPIHYGEAHDKCMECIEALCDYARYLLRERMFGYRQKEV